MIYYYNIKLIRSRVHNLCSSLAHDSGRYCSIALAAEELAAAQIAMLYGYMARLFKEHVLRLYRRHRYIDQSLDQRS